MPGNLKAGRYEIEEEIGRGGMGRVYRARDTRLGRTVALKMLPAELVGDADLRRRLATEARAASALNHPGIATVHDYVEADGECFIVYEFVEGVTLRERMARQRLSTEEILELGAQLADAVAAAHDRSVVHRDLKPENIMLAAGPASPGRAKILDFGLAKVLEPLATAAGPESGAETATAGTARGVLLGTVNYMSPEQLEGEPADARADIHALGLVLYEVAAGAHPYLGKTPTSTIANILKQEPPPVLDRNPVAPAELDRILRKCLRKRREERYQSARDLLVDFSNLRRDSGSRLAAPAGPSAAAPAFRLFKRRTARILLMMIQVGYVAMYGAYFYRFPGLVGEKLMPGRMQEAFLMGFGLCAIAGTPIRLYLFSAVLADYPDLGQKFRWLFLALLLLDLFWAATPMLFTGYGLWFVISAAAGLAYLPFSHRWLIYEAYRRAGGRRPDD